MNIYIALTILFGLCALFLREVVKRSVNDLFNDYRFTDVLAQLKTQTQATEAIKTNLSHEDWSQKEYKTLKRTKLEQYVICVNKIPLWLHDICTHVVKEQKLTEAFQKNPSMEIVMLQTLYFPELETLSQSILDQIAKFMTDVHSVKFIIAQHGLAYNDREKTVDPLYEKNIKTICKSIEKFNLESKKLMQALIIPKT